MQQTTAQILNILAEILARPLIAKTHTPSAAREVINDRHINPCVALHHPVKW